LPKVWKKDKLRLIERQLNMNIQKIVVEKFLRYIKIDTCSDYSITDQVPTTDTQFNLAHLLADELKIMGIKDASVNEKCFVLASLPANTDKKIPVIGFLAHLDTSPDFNGNQVNPQIVEKYDGGEILLDKTSKKKLSPSDFAELPRYIGQTLITTDGSSLLGADDKAGVAEIMTVLEYLVSHPEVKHGTLKIAFTPDEETGMGVDNLDVKAFGADFAYTLDGGGLGELEYENFNAARVILQFHGKSVHPGDAKNILVNSQLLAMELNSLLPVEQRPEYTSGREGFFHLHGFSGDVSETKVEYLIRDHNRQKYEAKKELMQNCVDFIKAKYGPGSLDAVIEDRYFNMREILEKVFHIVETAKEAMLALGIEPIINPIRGGTDGARLSIMGLPTPNLFAGGHNFHGPYEYIPTASMEKAVLVSLKIIELYTNK
jgi:tripeptide aminopeptidase